jgi:molybdopterin synthase sulfur carrier subunit
MPTVEIPSRYSVPTGGARNFELAGASVRECVAELEAQHPGIQELIIDRKGEMKLFVRIFVDGELLPRDALDAELPSEAAITVVAAAAGG